MMEEHDTSADDQTPESIEAVLDKLVELDEFIELFQLEIAKHGADGDSL